MAKTNLVWKPTPDGQSVFLEMHVDGVAFAHMELDAAGLEESAHLLATARASLPEPVLPKVEVGMRLEAIGDPAWNTEPYLDYDGVALSLRHPGFGWLSFLLPQGEARTLGKALSTGAEILAEHAGSKAAGEKKPD